MTGATYGEFVVCGQFICSCPRQPQGLPSRLGDNMVWSVMFLRFLTTEYTTHLFALLLEL